MPTRLSTTTGEEDSHVADGTEPFDSAGCSDGSLDRVDHRLLMAPWNGYARVLGVGDDERAVTDVARSPTPRNWGPRDPQLEALVGSAFALMTGVLRPLGSSLTEMPVGEQHPGRTTGPCFEMYYPMGNFVPWRDSAWAVLAERVSVLADRCDVVQARIDSPRTMAGVAVAARAIAARLAAHVPRELLVDVSDHRRS